MLETRLLARTEPLDYASDLPIRTQRWNTANPAAPVALRDGEADTPTMQRLPAIYEAVGEEMRPVLDWRRAQSLIAAAPNLPAGFYLAPDVEALNAALQSPDRVMLGEAQERWLRDELTNSVRANTVWQVLGNQVIMAPVTAPDLSATPPQLAAALERLSPGVTQLLKLTRFPFPLSTDHWDGYPQARARVFEAVRATGGNTLVITGDSHKAWANELNDALGRVAVEFGAASITSPSEGDYFTPFGVDFAGGLRARNPHVKHIDPNRRGFLLITLTREQATAEFFSVSTIQSKQYEVERTAAFVVATEAGPGIGPILPAT
jgi:alkaline phosphatase D